MKKVVSSVLMLPAIVLCLPVHMVGDKSFLFWPLYGIARAGVGYAWCVNKMFQPDFNEHW